MAWVAQETELSERIAIEYVLDGDEALRRVEARLQQAAQTPDPMTIAVCHERLPEIDG